jgi:hypothetical protein
VFHDRTGASNPREANLGLDVFPSPADQWVRCRAWKGLDAEAEQVVLRDYFDDAARRPPLTGTHSKPIEHLLPRRDGEATTTAWPALCSHSPRTRVTASCAKRKMQGFESAAPDTFGPCRWLRWVATRLAPADGRRSAGGDYISRKGSSAASLAVCDRKFESATPTSRTPFGGGNTDRIRSRAT